MPSHECSASVVRGLTVLVVASALGWCGCAVIGPRAITAGRSVYANVINQTDDEQILNMIVRMRYNESSSLISVASITASLRFSSQIGTNIGIGSSDNYAGTYENNVREILDLLGITAKPDGASILLPFRMAVGRSASAIHVQTRSAYEVLQVFGAGIEIPPAHIEAGIVEPTAWEPPEDRKLFRIRSSQKRPKNATVQIEFRDRWFYIDAADTPSKRAFIFLRTFIAMRLAVPAGAQQTPVLTVPVN